MIDDGERPLRGADRPARHAQAFERLRTRHLMHEVAIDIEQGRAIILAVDDMVVPDLVVNGAGRGFGHLSLPLAGLSRSGSLV